MTTIRVLMTKSFIDSHDRAIKTVSTALRDASMEVVLIDYETPKDIVDVAIDEDVDVIGLSFMSGGQVDVTTQVMRLLQSRGAEGLPVIVGGAIRPFDVPPLEAVGVSAIFRGGEKLSSMAEAVRRIAHDRAAAADGPSADALVDGLRRGDRRMLSQAISEIEDGTDLGRDISAALRSDESAAFSVGVTGPPGAGKSTLISALAPKLADHGQRVAVLLVDPSSPVSGGAVLGDRVRFSQAARRDDLFVRSFGNRGQAEGVIAGMREVLAVLRAGGYSTTIIETVGSGQSDVAITSLVDCTVLATPPGLGDSIQALKAGIQEVADLFVVTKGDRPGADQLYRQLRGVPRRPGDDQPRKVLRTSATGADGVDELVTELLQRQQQTTRERATT